MCNKHENSSLMAFIKCKCPQCRSGKFFTHPFYNPSKFLHFNEYCPVCGLKFEKETGFFWSAMYISYGINVAIGLIIGILLNLFIDNPSVNTYLFWILGVVIIGSTLIFRYSRMIALHFVSGYKYDKSKTNK